MPARRMHFALLGPLEASYDGRLLDLGRPKQRTVLATLLLHANRVVSLDRFADILWPDGVATSPGSLPVYVANLRRLLEPERPARTPPQRILTRPPGYLLRVAPAEFDVADFERLAAEGNRHLAEGRPQAARRALGEGLSLWRGPALEEFPFAELRRTVSTGCGWQPPRTGSKPTSRWGTTPKSWPSWSTWSTSTPCVSGWSVSS